MVSVFPLGAPTGGKFRVTGSGFSGATELKIGPAICPFVVEGPASILATVPVGADTGPVVVSTLLGTAASSADFRVVTAAKIAAALQEHSSNSGTGLVMLYEFPGEPTLVFHESYQSGNAATARLVASATKTLNGILLAAALDDGIILSLQEKVSDVITEWQTDPLKAQITLDHLLTLSSGLESGGAIGGLNFSDAINQPLSASTVTNGIGTEFVYGPEPFQVFGLYLIRRMGLSTNPVALGAVHSAQFQYGDAVLPMAMSWLKQRVNSVAGTWRWSAINTTPNEQDPAMGGGGLFTTMEFARMGQFLMNRGTQTYGGTPVNVVNTYGRCAWIGYGGMPPETSIPPTSLYSAAGAGKNMSWVLPAFRMVIGRNAGVPAGASLSQHAFFVALGLANP